MHFTNAITRKPPITISNGITSQNAQVDAALADQQHAKYVSILQALGIKVHVLPALEAFPDSHFVEDTAIIYKQNMIITRPGASERRGECDELLRQLPVSLNTRHCEYEDTGLVDGGDIIIVGDQVLIGISQRTNEFGAEVLRKALVQINPNVKISFIEFSELLHLKSGLIALTPKLLLGNPKIKIHSPINDFEIIWLPEEEGYAANCLVVNNHAIIFPDCPSVQDAVKRAGLSPIQLDISEFRKMDGSFTCLSLLW